MTNKLITLHAGSWDGYHLVGVFSDRRKAESFVKCFNITDNPTIEEIEVNPLSDILESGKLPYLITCKKKKDNYVKVKLAYEYFHENNVHFNHGTMYYYVAAINENEAREIGQKMRDKLVNEDWEINFNLGIQKL